MNPKYCLDTSGFSYAVQFYPHETFVSLWKKIRTLINSDMFCWNEEIGKELTFIDKAIDNELKDCQSRCCRKLGSSWAEEQDYLALIQDWQDKYKENISENKKHQKGTIGINDLSIVALAKVLKLPVLSGEVGSIGSSPNQRRMKIPNLCDKEQIKHLSFLEFLKAENIII